jgi:hypothetical protein
MNHIFGLLERIGSGVERVASATLPIHQHAANNNNNDLESGGAGANTESSSANPDAYARAVWRRIGANTTALSSPQPIREHLSPLRAFAQCVLPEMRAADQLPIYVVYSPANAECRIAFYLEPGSFLVNAALDVYYREALMSAIVDPKYARRVAHYASVSAQDMEEADSAACEMLPLDHTERPCRMVGKYRPSDWLVYTHSESALIRDMRAMAQHDPLFDFYEDPLSSDDVLGISPVAFPVVCFFCGALPEFVNEVAPSPTELPLLPTPSTMPNTDGTENTDDIVIALDETGSKRAKTPEMAPRSEPRYMTLSVPESTRKWLSVPPWFLTLRRHGMPPTNGAAHAHDKPSTANAATWLDASSLAMNLQQSVGTLALTVLPDVNARALHGYLTESAQQVQAILEKRDSHSSLSPPPAAAARSFSASQ